MKNSTLKSLNIVVDRLSDIELLIKKTVKIQDDVPIIKEAREFGYISKAVTDLESLLEDMKKIRSEYFTKDE